jgi:aspartate/methionine/tyrosine aminotransferase
MLAFISPFARLRGLLDPLTPEQTPIDLSIGAPRHDMPTMVIEQLNAGSTALAAGLERYPAINGLGDVRGHVCTWLKARFGAILNPELNISLCNGSREGLFYAGLHAVNLKRSKGCAAPIVAYPNPLYPVYSAVAPVSGAQNLPLPPTNGGFGLPDLEAITPETLSQLACLYIAAPANPQGTLAPQSYWQNALQLARDYDFFLFADECYSEIYYGERPKGALTAAQTLSSFDKLISFNSLSKRSNVPGLRFGFLAGDDGFITGFNAMRNVCGPQMSEPTQRLGAALLGDEHHVEDNRQLYAQKMLMAKQHLGWFSGFTMPEGGFCLWLDISSLGNDEEIAAQLWQSFGLKTIPGSYVSQDVAGQNPGEGFLRLALVGSMDETLIAMQRLSAFLSIKLKGQ